MSVRRYVVVRVTDLPRRRARALSLAFAPSQKAFYRPEQIVISRSHVVPKKGRRLALILALAIVAPRTQTKVIPFRVQSWPHLYYPVFTPYRRRLKALGQTVAPIIVVGGGGSGMNLQHALGLSLMSLGGTRF